MILDTLYIYTDGAARGNPGKGGYGIVMLWKGIRKEISAGYRYTTNNRMELLAVIVALESLTKTGLPICITTDSKYVVDAVEKGWLMNWVKIQFKNKKNRDLWLRFLNLYQQHHIKFHWVKGHASHVENNRCDALATAAADGSNLLVDEWFEQHKEETLL